MKVLLIDALNVIRRVYEALRDHDGAEALDSVVRGSMGSIKRAVSEVGPSHAICVFEGEGRTWRHERFPAYKANRPPTPEAVQRAVAQCREALDELGLAAVAVPQVEADDVIASIAAGLDRRGIDTVILSTDQDFLQLISEHVVVRHHVAKEYRDARWVEHKYGVPAHRYREVLAMMGDSANNIPGVPGIGPKKAAALLQQYDSIGTLLADAEKIKGKLGETIRAHADDLQLSLELVTLKNDVHVGLNLRDAKVSRDDRVNA